MSKSILSIENNLFLSPLQSVLGVIENANNMSILSNVLIQRKEDYLYFTSASDELQLTATTKLAELVAENTEFATTVNAKKLAVILKTFNANDKLEITLNNNDDDDGKFIVNCNKSKFNLQTLPIEDFPIMENDDEKTTTFSLKQNEFKNLLKQVQYAVAKKDIRYYLNGLFLDIKKHKIICVATDGHRLSYAAQTYKENLPECNALIPLKTITELIKLLSDVATTDIEISIGKRNIKFEFNNITIFSKLIDATFPDYNNVIPTEYKIAFAVDRKNLIKAIQRVNILSNLMNPGVAFDISKGMLRLSTQNAEQENAFEDVEIIGEISENFNIGFNSQYVLDKLNNLSDEFVVFRFKDADSAGFMSGYSYIKSADDLVTLPIESDGEDKDENEEFIAKKYEKYVVMPMRI